MITNDDRQTIEGIVKEFVSKKWSFTAYTITEEARKKGITVYHSEAKQIVHDMFDDGEMTDYSRKVEDVNAAVKPFRYYHDDSATTAVPADNTATDATADELDDLDDDVDRPGDELAVSSDPIVDNQQP